MVADSCEFVAPDTTIAIRRAAIATEITTQTSYNGSQTPATTGHRVQPGPVENPYAATVSGLFAQLDATGRNVR